MDLVQIKNFKDFLLMYNQVSDTCFSRCINTFNSREIDPDEEFCVNKCVQKHININHKIMGIYIEVQPVLVNKKIEEANAAQAALEMQQQQETSSQTIVSTHNTQQNDGTG